jgi:phage terminase large subunit-like protein
VPAVAERKRPTRTIAPPRPWWGYGKSRLRDGDAPHLRWPGVTIEIPCAWHTKRERWETPDGQYYFDREAADRACDFFPDLLKHHIGEFAGEPFVLRADQAMLLVRPLFGWKRASDGLRRFRKVFAFCPKGYGKSPLGAGLGLYCARCEGEAAAEVYAVAGDRQQARIVHDNAKIMVEGSPLLHDGAEVTKDAITWADTMSVYRVLSSEASTAHGLRPYVVIFDELHAQKNRSLYEALYRSMVKRGQPIMIIITHSGEDDENICFEEYEYAKSVLSGHSQDDTCLPVLFEATPEDDWTSPTVWARVNPGHGVTVKRDAIARECQEAMNEPRKRNDFLRYHLNRWVNQATAWIPVDWWDACDAPMPSEVELLKCQGAIGIDMAQKIDLASAVAVFRLPLEEPKDESIEVVNFDDAGQVITRRLSLNYRIAIVPAFWLPEETLRERVHQDRVPYDRWHDQRIAPLDLRLLNTTDGALIDSDAIVTHVRELVKRFPLLKQGEIGYDPAFATEIGIRLRDTYGLTAIEILQNYKHLSEACQVFEALVKAKRVIHGGHRLLRWNVENVAVKTDDAGRIRPVKPKRQTKRIDGVVATLMALSRVMVMPPTKKRAGAFVV